MSDKTNKRPPHPSGKPIRYSEYKRLPITRVPFNGPLTPDLRQQYQTNAIGFTAKLSEEFDD